jgi:glycosyltransferase involved in cell wall biosynthesis
MKYVIVSTTSNMGGAHIASKKLYDELHKTDLDVSYLSLEKISGFKYIYKFFILCERMLKKIFGDTKSTIFSSSGMYGLISKKDLEKFDIVNIHWISAGCISLFVLRNISNKLIITCHDAWWVNGLSHHKSNEKSFLSKYVKDLKKEILINSKVIITPSLWLKNEMIKNIPEIKNKIKVIPNITVHHNFQEIKNNYKNIKKVVIQKRNIKIGVCYSNFYSNTAKGSDDILKLIKYLDKNKLFNFQIIHAGKIGNNLNEIDISKYIVHLGELNSKNMKEFYNSIDIFLNLSKFENLSNTLVECLMYAIPSIAYDVGGNKEINNTNNNICIKYNSNEVILSQSIFDLMNIKTEFNEQHIQKFTNEKIIKEYKNVCK